MKYKITYKKGASIIALLVFIVSGISSCSHYDEIIKNPVFSRHGDSESHYLGRNCMECHKSGGQAVTFFDTQQIWNIGGSIFNSDGITPNSNGTLYLYTKANGQGVLKYVIEVDANGNFYTNQIIDFREALFPYIRSALGTSAYMSTSLTTGACNSCHGVTTARITIN
jgi:hypothetical protein